MLPNKMLRLLSILITACFISVKGMAQVVVEAKLDTANILIGEQVQIRVKCSAPSSQQVTFPYFQPQQELTKGVEVIGNGPTDTVTDAHAKRMTLTRRYTITSFDSALYSIPPFKVMVDGKEYTSTETIGLKVSTLAVDTIHVDKFNGPHDVVELPFVWSWRITLIALLAILAALVTLGLIIRLSDPRLITRKVVIHPPVPAHITAINDIQRIKQQPATDVKEYYTELTDTLRQYIEKRFGFNALEMTTSEIIDELCATEQTEALSELKEVLLKADLVKFAKHNTSLSEQDHSLIQALDFVQHTKIEPVEQPKPRVEYVTLTGNKQRTLRTGMTVGAILSGLVACGLLAYTIYDLYCCFG